jgi:50S ribosomal subunit-associated GTPase HflX
MDLPLSSRTLLSSGKVREVAAACADADIAVFVAALSKRQQRVLTELFGCPAVSLAEALAAG